MATACRSQSCARRRPMESMLPREEGEGGERCAQLQPGNADAAAIGHRCRGVIARSGRACRTWRPPRPGHPPAPAPPPPSVALARCPASLSPPPPHCGGRGVPRRKTGAGSCGRPCWPGRVCRWGQSSRVDSDSPRMGPAPAPAVELEESATAARRVAEQTKAARVLAPVDAQAPKRRRASRGGPRQS